MAFESEWKYAKSCDRHIEIHKLHLIWVLNIHSEVILYRIYAKVYDEIRDKQSLGDLFALITDFLQQFAGLSFDDAEGLFFGAIFEQGSEVRGSLFEGG